MSKNKKEITGTVETEETIGAENTYAGDPPSISSKGETVTGYELARLEAYLQQYKLAGDYEVMEEEGGKNNTTRMVYSGMERYVLRIYDNHKDIAKVRFEHQVLLELNAHTLDFEIPQPVRNIYGDTVSSGEEGKLAAVYAYLEGERPDRLRESHISGLGQACGNVSRALGQLHLQNKPSYTPYYVLQDNYGHLEKQTMLQWVKADIEACELESMMAELEGIRRRLVELEAAFCKLPRQWIHGDIGFTNALARGEKVTGVLDFEFCTRDLRAMELAVVLPELITEESSEQSLRQIRLFTEGFGSKQGLTAEEISYLPDLMQLRMVDVYLHFAERFRQQLDPLTEWSGHTRRAAFVCRWIEDNRTLLALLFGSCLTGRQVIGFVPEKPYGS